MQIKIFSINMWLLPFRLSKEKKQRLKTLVGYIKKSSPDIAALQEVFMKQDINFIKKNLSKEYHVSHASGRVFNRSGLVVLSKKKPSSVSFYPFLSKKGMLNKIARRGILRLDFGKRLSIYNTHLYVRPGDPSIELTLEELKYLKSIIDKSKDSILCGDLNLQKHEFDRHNNGFFKYAEDTGNTFSYANRYIKKWWDKDVVADKKIDYILIRLAGKNTFSYNSRLVDRPLMSDHYGIFSEIKIED